MPWLHLQAMQADGLCLGLPVKPEHLSLNTSCVCYNTAAASLTQLVAAKYVPLLEVSFHFCFINQWVFLWLEFSVSEDFKSIHFFTTICSFYVAGVTHHQPKKGRSLAPPLRDTFIYCIRRKFNLLPARATVEAKKKNISVSFWLQQWEEFILYSRFSPCLLRSRS